MADSDVLSYAIPVAGFRSRKAAQICAWFALQTGGCIEKLKLIKLIYFSERDFLREHHTPMLFDEFYSLYNGPICSSTLNGINGVANEDTLPIWESYIARNGNIVSAVRRFQQDDLDEISPAEWDVLEGVFHRLGDRTASQLRNLSHEQCPEYTQVRHGRRLPISYREVLEALGDDEADLIDMEVQQTRLLEVL